MRRKVIHPRLAARITAGNPERATSQRISIRQAMRQHRPNCEALAFTRRLRRERL